MTKKNMRYQPLLLRLLSSSTSYIFIVFVSCFLLIQLQLCSFTIRTTTSLPSLMFVTSFVPTYPHHYHHYQTLYNNNNKNQKHQQQLQQHEKKSHLSTRGRTAAMTTRGTTTTSTTMLHLQNSNNNQQQQQQKQQIVTNMKNNNVLESDDFKKIGTSSSTTSNGELIGTDSGLFELSEQKISDWFKFTGAVGAILSFVAYIWIVPFGLQGGEYFVQWIQTTFVVSTNTYDSDPTAITMGIMLTIFAILHSGLAFLRTIVVPKYIGERPWRVIFASISLPTAFSCITYFINHGHDGTQLWDISHYYYNSNNVDDIGPLLLHGFLFCVNFISFLFLYPATFDLLEVAAITKPKITLWETGIIRITRHPQAIGQFLWCFGHTLYFGTSTALVASSILILHHILACYHGDYRLQLKHGNDFQYIKERTSILPFQAIIEGRQILPNDYYKEFIRLPYLTVVIGTISAYFLHPYFLAGSALVNW